VLEKKLTGEQIVANALIKKINDFDPKVAAKPK
jgi:hypothetical protein